MGHASLLLVFRKTSSLWRLLVAARDPVARFGSFEWQPSTSEDVVAEIAEFSYNDVARLFLVRGRSPPRAAVRFDGPTLVDPR